MNTSLTTRDRRDLQTPVAAMLCRALGKSCQYVCRLWALLWRLCSALTLPVQGLGRYTSQTVEYRSFLMRGISPQAHRTKGLGCQMTCGQRSAIYKDQYDSASDTPELGFIWHPALKAELAWVRVQVGFP